MATKVEHTTNGKASDKFETLEWMGYLGDLPLSCDASSNRGAVKGLISTLLKGDFQVHTIAANKWAAGAYNPRMTMKNLKIEGRVGIGEHGVVWKAKLDGVLDVAVKQFNVTKCTQETIWMERDALIYLKSVGSRRVVNLVGAFFDVDAFLIMELCLCKQLCRQASVKDAVGNMTDKDKSRFMLQLLQGLEFIHSKSIWHCDIRPDNLLITTSNNLVIADFGKAIYAPGKDKVECKSNLGVSYYSDYQANCESIFSNKTDVWAAGCSIYELWNGECLMRYDKRTDVSKIEYGKVALFGKLDNYSADNTLQDAERTPLKDLIVNVPYARVLRLMITPTWKTRCDAKTILNGRHLSGLCQTLEIDVQKVDNDAADIIAVEPRKRVAPPSFNAVSAVTPDKEVTLRLYGIYYDELEKTESHTCQPSLYRPLASQCGTDFLRCLHAQGVLEKFIDGVSNNNPVCLASCIFVVNKSMGMEQQATQLPSDVGSAHSSYLKKIAPIFVVDELKRMEDDFAEVTGGGVTDGLSSLGIYDTTISGMEYRSDPTVEAVIYRTRSLAEGIDRRSGFSASVVDGCCGPSNQQNDTNLTPVDFNRTKNETRKAGAEAGSGTIKRQRNDNSLKKKGKAETEEKNTLSSNITHRTLRYKCINHEKGCQFKGGKDIVSTHMVKCDFNSSDDSDESNNESSSSSSPNYQ